MKIKLKSNRTAKGLTQQQLADMMPISRSYLSQLETGARIPNLNRLQTAAMCLGVQTSDLLDEPLKDLKTLRLLDALEFISAEDLDPLLALAESLAAKGRAMTTL